MSKLGIKYEGCQDAVDKLEIISKNLYQGLIDDLNDISKGLNNLTNKPDTTSLNSCISKVTDYKEKLSVFVPKFENFINEISTFDNTFHENFVHLDGTNYENYQKNILDLDNVYDFDSLTSEEQHEILQFLADLNLAAGLYGGDDDPFNAARVDAFREYLKLKVNSDFLKSLAKTLKEHKAGVAFREMIDESGNIYIKAVSKKFKATEIEKFAEFLHNDLGVLSKKELKNLLGSRYNFKKFAEDLLSDEGALLYKVKKSGGKGSWNSSVFNKIMSGNDKELKDLIKSIPEKVATEATGSGIKAVKNSTKLGKFGTTFMSSIKENGKWLGWKNVVDDFSGWKGASKATKLAKGVGVADTLYTGYLNVRSNFYENGEFSKEKFFDPKNIGNFVADEVVDVGVGLGATATGAAVGSLIAPPLGTVVGAGVGALVNVGMNWEFGNPPKSAVSRIKDIAHDGVSGILDAGNSIKNSLGKIFW